MPVTTASRHMKQVSIDKLFDLYLDTIARCRFDLDERSPAEVEYDLFEEFDVGATSFLHDDALRRLHEAGYIDREAQQWSRELRRQWLELQQSSRNIEDIKTDGRWRVLFELAERLHAKHRHSIIDRLK